MTAEEQAVLEPLLRDPLWRLTSGELYHIAPADGSGVQPFKPRPEQIRIFEEVHLNGKRRILIPKARRLGMSTALGIMMLDWCLWKSRQVCELIDRNEKEATKKLGGIVGTALDHLPAWLKSQMKILRRNDSAIEFDLRTGKSTMQGGINARGGSNDFLWVSEWGVIQAEEPKRSSAIRSGALPSARHGLTVIETTWAGGKGGDVWELLEPTLKGEADDWLVLFFPWWIDPRNVHENASMDEASRKYFTRIEPRLQGDGITLSEQQKRWWAKERREQGIFMQRENPTFLDECWTAPIKGAILAEEVSRAFAEGRIAQMPVDGASLVHTSWDLGSPANTVCWYWQVVGRMIRVIDCDTGGEETMLERVARMLQKPYNYGRHYLPHDSLQTERSGDTLATVLTRAGLRNLVTVPPIHSIWVGINALCELFPSLEFRLPECDRGIDGLQAWRTRETPDGRSEEPVHDWASHIGDALRTLAEAHRAGMVAFTWGPGVGKANQEPREPWERGHRRRGMKAQTVGG